MKRISWAPLSGFRLASRHVVAAVFVLSLISQTFARSTICRPDGDTCTGTRSCATVIQIPDLGTYSFDVSGPALASVHSSEDRQSIELDWLVSNFSGLSSDLGQINIGLLSTSRSWGNIISTEPDSLDFFPAINTNYFFFKFDIGNFPSLVSNGPVQIQAEINSIPPADAIYHLLAPVDLYALGDENMRTVATILSAEIHFVGEGPTVGVIVTPVPESSTAQAGAIPLLVIIVMVRYRRRQTRH